jgi:hypothetical protein
MQFLPNLSPGMNGGPSMYGVKKMSVAKLVVQTAGTYGDQWRRPMSSHGDGRLVNVIEDVLAKTSNINALSVAAPALEFLKPAATPEARVQIVNGWQTPRYRFLLHIVVEDMMGVVTDHYYSGYTEYTDPSYSGQIDPKMIFTINGATAAKRIRREQLGMGMVTLNTPIAHNQILNAQGYGGVLDPNKTYSLRPETVVDDIMSEGLRSVADTFSNTSSYITAPTASSRSNNSAPDYMAKLLKTYRNGVLGSTDSESRDQSLEHVKRVLEIDSSSDKFMGWLQARRVQMSTGMTLSDVMGFDQFTLKDLEALDPTALQRVKPADSMSITNDFHVAGRTSDWGASTAHAQMATMLAQSMPTYMTSYYFNFVHLHATNMTLDGQIEVLVGNAVGVNNNVDNTPFVEAFKQRLITELFVSISHGNTMPFSVEIKCDLLGETWVTISLAQQAEEEFVCPTFCDSLFAPMLTTNQNLLQGLSHDFGKIFDVVDQQVSTMQLQQANYTDTSGSNLQMPKIQVPNIGLPVSNQSAGITPISLPSINQPNSFGKKNPGF